MANEIKDVLRVEGAETGIYTSIRERQNGYTIDGSEPKKIIHKYVGGAYGTWTDDAGTLEIINERITNTDVNDEDVAVSIADAASLTNQELVNEYLLGPDIEIIRFTDDASNLEKGDTLASISIEYGITGTISNVTIDDPDLGITSLQTGYSGAFTTAYSPDLGNTGVYTWTLTATDPLGNTNTDTNTMFFGLYSYWGQSAQPYSSINETIIEAASSGGSTLEQDTAASKSKSSFSQAGGGNYLYYAYPASWGALSSITVNGFGSTWERATVSVTNSQGNTENYYAYVSPNVINGTVTLAFS